MDDVSFGITGDEALCSEYGVTAEGVVMVKTFDDGKATLTEDLTEENIAKFVWSESLPLVIDFNHETAQKIFSGEVKSHFLMFSSAKADDHEDKHAASEGWLVSRLLLVPASWGRWCGGWDGQSAPADAGRWVAVWSPVRSLSGSVGAGCCWEPRGPPPPPPSA